MQLLEVDANSLIMFVLFFFIRGTAIELDVVLTNDHGGHPSVHCSGFMSARSHNPAFDRIAKLRSSSCCTLDWPHASKSVEDLRPAHGCSQCGANGVVAAHLS